MHNISVAVSVDFIASKAWAYLEGGGGPPIEEIFAPFKDSLSSFLPNHVYNLCR